MKTTFTVSRRRRAFTLIELLVVIGVIALLTAIAIPALGAARIRSQAVACASNFHQLCLSSTLYSNDDHKGRLPSFVLPVESSALAKYHALEPWFLPHSMITNMGNYGVLPHIWYCPARSGWRDLNGRFALIHNGQSINTAQDLWQVYAVDLKAAMTPVDTCWWVPRGLENSSIVYPDSTLLQTRVREQWPASITDQSASLMPIASDWLVAGWDNARKVVLRGTESGGHAFAGKLRSCNVAFADGRVETRPSARIQWQLVSNPNDHVVLY